MDIRIACSFVYELSLKIKKEINLYKNIVIRVENKDLLNNYNNKIVAHIILYVILYVILKKIIDKLNLSKDEIKIANTLYKDCKNKDLDFF